ncbi:MAG TPA: hypothetical protein VL326_18860 [Kofleriaceae bacterium]|nr:hypothetical protein [Kofleriaceae bacterium]
MTTVKLVLGDKAIRVDNRVAKLSNKKLRSLAPLAPLGEVEELDIGYNALTSLADMPRFPKLHTLQAFGMKLEDLRGIERAPALARVSADVKDASALRKLRNLTHVWLTTQAKDLRFLAGLPKLQYIAITAPLTSLAGIERLPSLGELVVHGAKLSRLKAVTHPVLWKLIVSDSGLQQVPDVRTPKLLLALFHDNAISRMGKLDAPVLRNLNVSGNPLTHLEGLDHLKGLEELSFDGRRIKTIAKATDAHLRGIGQLRLSVASRGVADYATYAAKKPIV